MSETKGIYQAGPALAPAKPETLVTELYNLFRCLYFGREDKNWMIPATRRAEQLLLQLGGPEQAGARIANCIQALANGNAGNLAAVRAEALEDLVTEV